MDVNKLYSNREMPKSWQNTNQRNCGVVLFMIGDSGGTACAESDSLLADNCL